MVLVFLSSSYIQDVLITQHVEHRAHQNAIQTFEQTDREYLGEVCTETERNLRVLQFYVWCLKESWRGNIYMTMGAIGPYLSFVDSHRRKSEDYHENPLVPLIRRLNDRFKRTEKDIEFLNAQKRLSEAKRVHLEDYFTSVVNEAIDVVKAISQRLGDNTYSTKSYLSKAWRDRDKLEANGKYFINSERRNVVSGQQATAKPF